MRITHTVTAQGQDLRSFIRSATYWQLTQHAEDYRGKNLRYWNCQHVKGKENRKAWLLLTQPPPIWFSKHFLVTSCWFHSLFQATKLHLDTWNHLGWKRPSASPSPTASVTMLCVYTSPATSDTFTDERWTRQKDSKRSGSEANVQFGKKRIIETKGKGAWKKQAYSNTKISKRNASKETNSFRNSI